ncbi:pyridoxamine 5'-phosphate oxidase family protein [Saccharothrix xinjiangensis]|uniref:Pyridoxamine 5'-phosphate oxidase family protein n=1 Tax=Saccharothrix xinjiangensis TaxID=204798 RepID=A0ABV9XYC2_9PSEU
MSLREPGEENDPYRPHRLTKPSVNYSSGQVSYDKQVAESILDDTFHCQIAYFDPEEEVVRIVPRQYGRSRDGDFLYVHGPGDYPDQHAEPPVEHSSRLYRLVRSGKVRKVTVSVAIVDALVPAQAAPEAVLSYRSVVIFGRACAVLEGGAGGEKCSALHTITNHIMPGYADHSRKADKEELGHVGVIRIDFEHVSSKVRNGGPPASDDSSTHWAGVVPVRQVYGPPITAPDLRGRVPVPEYVKNLTGSRGAHELVVDPRKHSDEPRRLPGAPRI